MSVPLHRRSENKLDAYVKTLAMVKYTMQMIENEKLFPKKSRWNLVSKIADNCLDSLTEIRQANKIQAKTEEQAKFRLELQFDVLLHFDALWGLMTVAYESYCIPSNKIETWCNLLQDAEDKVSAWRRYDTKRFSEEFKI